MTIHESRVRRSRSLGLALTPKAARIMERRPTPPGQHGAARRSSKSIYGQQLLEKQRLRYLYNISDSALRRYCATARTMQGPTPENLQRLLEMRVDNFICRAGFAPTIYAARQFVNHGHIMINGRQVGVPGCAVKLGDVVTLTERGKKILLIKETAKSAIVPSYIHLDRETITATLNRVPESSEFPSLIKMAMVVEFCAR